MFPRLFCSNFRCCRLHKFQTPMIQFKLVIRQCSTAPQDLVINHDVVLDPEVKEQFQNEEITSFRKHPGVLNLKAINIPVRLNNAVNVVLKNFPVSDIKPQSQKLVNYLWGRSLPLSDAQISDLARQHHFRLLESENVDVNELSTEDKITFEHRIEKRLLKDLRNHIYHWKSIEYNAVKSLCYMVGRLAPEYSSLYRVMHEIKSRDPLFVPKTMCDFGSGVGTSTWVVNNLWPNKVYEHYCVDASMDMNALARLLLQGGEDETEMCYKGVYFRHHLPFSSEAVFDLVVSSYSLMELASQKDRIQILLSLWEKTDKYLVLVENGTFAGFSLLSEARDFLLQTGMQNPHLKGHVFAPCPHDFMCPRGLRSDGTPCNFEQKYKVLDIHKGETEHRSTRFSYLILKKGDRDPRVTSWPRIVRPVSKPSKRIHCRTCSRDGELHMSIITRAKHGRELYRCAKASNWGDLLPMVPGDGTLKKHQGHGSQKYHSTQPEIPSINVEQNESLQTEAYGDFTNNVLKEST